MVKRVGIACWWWFKTGESISTNERKNNQWPKINPKGPLWPWKIVYILNNFPLQFKMCYILRQNHRIFSEECARQLIVTKEVKISK